MKRIMAVGDAAQEIYLVDYDDLGGIKRGGENVFSGLSFGSHTQIDKLEFHVGGSAASAAVSFARFGHDTIFMGNIAKDVAGEAIIRCFDEENIDTSYLEFIDGVSATNIVLVNKRSGDYTDLQFFGVAGVSKNLEAKNLELAQPEWLYLSSIGGNMDKCLELTEKAKELGCKIMWCPGKKELIHTKQVLGLLEDIDVLALNKEEACMLVPGVILTELSARLRNYCKTVIITDGIMGAIASDADQTYRIGMYEQGGIKDLNSVDDAFASGFLAKFADTNDFITSLKFASANACSVAQHYGAETGILTGKEELHEVPMIEIKEENYGSQ